jgi:hypothetical protein
VIAASVTGAVRRDTNKKRREGPTLLDENVAQAEEIKGLKAEIAELQAAREFGLYIDDTDDDAALAGKILGWIGKERAALLVLELQRLIRAASEAA